MLFTDQLGRTITFNNFPRKIISLVPSQTELLYDLGLENEIAGITKFCIHPEKIFRSKPHIGGTKQLNFERIKSISPDLIIGNKEENEQIQIEELMKHYPVWMSDVRNLTDAYHMIDQVGALTGKSSDANRIIHEIKSEFEMHLSNKSTLYPKKNKAAYLIWNNPYMTINDNTFIHEMMLRAGFENVFADHPSRYPVISADILRTKNPDFIFLSSEPFPFKEKHREKTAGEFPKAQILLVNGELFSWYGSRLKLSPSYLKFISQICQLDKT